MVERSTSETWFKPRPDRWQHEPHIFSPGRRFVTAADKAARSFVPPPAAAKTGKKAAAKKVDGPKRPVPAYARFVKENYSLVKGRNPDKKNPEIFAELAKEYKALSPADKAKFKS